MSTGRNSLHLRILPSGVTLSFSFLECSHFSIQAWASRPLWRGEHPGGTWSERSSLGQTAWMARVPLPCSFAFTPTSACTPCISCAWRRSVSPCFAASPSCCPWSKPLALSHQSCTAKFISVPSNKLIVEAPVAFRNMWTFPPPLLLRSFLPQKFHWLALLHLPSQFIIYLAAPGLSCLT